MINHTGRPGHPSTIGAAVRVNTSNGKLHQGAMIDQAAVEKTNPHIVKDSASRFV